MRILGGGRERGKGLGSIAGYMPGGGGGCPTKADWTGPDRWGGKVQSAFCQVQEFENGRELDELE